MAMKAGTGKRHKTLSKPSNSCPLSQIKIQSPHCGIKALHDLPPPYPSEITSPHCAPAMIASQLFLNCAGHIPTSGPLHLLFLLQGMLSPYLPAASSFFLTQILLQTSPPQRGRHLPPVTFSPCHPVCLLHST